MNSISKILKISGSISNTRFNGLRLSDDSSYWGTQKTNGFFYSSLGYLVTEAKDVLIDLKNKIRKLLSDSKNAREFAESLDKEKGKKIIDLESILKAHKLWEDKLKKQASSRLAIFGLKSPLQTILDTKDDALDTPPSVIEQQFKYNKKFFNLVKKIQDEYEVLIQNPSEDSEDNAEKLLRDIDEALDMSSGILSKIYHEPSSKAVPKKPLPPKRKPEYTELTDEQLEFIEPEQEYAEVTDGQLQFVKDPPQTKFKSRRNINRDKKEEEKAIKNLPEMRSYFARLLRMKPESAAYKSSLKKLFSLLKDNFGEEADLNTVLTASSHISSLIRDNQRVRNDVVVYLSTLWGTL